MPSASLRKFERHNGGALDLASCCSQGTRLRLPRLRQFRDLSHATRSLSHAFEQSPEMALLHSLGSVTDTFHTPAAGYNDILLC